MGKGYSRGHEEGRGQLAKNQRQGAWRVLRIVKKSLRGEDDGPRSHQVQKEGTSHEHCKDYGSHRGFGCDPSDRGSDGGCRKAPCSQCQLRNGRPARA